MIGIPLIVALFCVQMIDDPILKTYVLVLLLLAAVPGLVWHRKPRLTPLDKA